MLRESGSGESEVKAISRPAWVVQIHGGPLRYISHLDYITLRYVGSMYLAIAT